MWISGNGQPTFTTFTEELVDRPASVQANAQEQGKQRSGITGKECDMLLWTGLASLVLGVLVWLFGNRLWLLGAATGALLGIGLLGRFEGLSGGWGGFLLVVGLAIALGVLGFIGRRFSKMVALVIGFIAGGAIALGLLDALGISLGFWDWILAVIVAAGAALAFRRYSDWAFIVLASLIGSLLVVRGVTMALLPSLSGPLGTVIIVALTALGVYYHYRQHAPKSVPPATSTG
jgi:hypothetical protein